MRISFFIFLTVFSMPLLANGIKPFTTDNCTGFSEGTHRHPDLWKDCCVEHDLYFWAGGNRSDRNLADLRLRDCIAARGEVFMSKIIYSGVRLGSLSPFKLQGKWGNGWKNRSSYESLSPKEKQIALDQIQNYPLDPVILENFILNLNARP